MSAALEADVVVVGSGVAGAMTAWKLAQQGFRTLILEAGPRIGRAEMVKSFTLTYKRDYSGGYPSVVGGTTWQWNASCLRFYPVDFKMKTSYGVGADWPIDYDTLEPFYVEAEYEIGVSRSKPFPMPPMPLSYSDKMLMQATGDAFVKFIHRPVARATRPYRGRGICEGFGTCAPVCPTGAQYCAITHVEMAEKAGARVLENARVDKFEADAEGNIAAVHGRRKDGAAFSARGKVFLLAANGMESPRLLMMSASERYPRGLANTSDAVGRHFMDHPGILGHLLMPKPVYQGRGPQSTMVSYSFRDGGFRRRRSGWLLAVNNAVRVPEIAKEFISKGLGQPELDAAIRDRARRQVELETQIELLPNPDNRLTLDWDNRDSAGQPKMKLYYEFSDYERAAFANVHETFARIADIAGARLLDVSEVFGHYHLTGMTRMGTDPKSSVVNEHCRAHDHRNLYVLSSSVFPTASTANPTLTLAALCLRASGEIARQLKT
jgi:choline dehydrogenase-like flavoprotein